MYFILRGLANHQKNFLRFCAVGVVNTAVDFGVFVLLYYRCGWPVLAAHALSFALAAANSYFLNRVWTFGLPVRGGHGRRFARFALVACGGLALSGAAVYVFQAWLPAWAAKLVAVGVSLGWNYAGSAFFVFRRR
jgi:putative flippase GtrA